MKNRAYRPMTKWRVVLALMLMGCAPALFAQSAGTAGATSLSKAERDYLTQYLRTTQKKFLDEIAGLSDAQLKFKPTPFAWSIAEVAQHLALAEDVIYNLVTQRVMKTPAQPQLKRDNAPPIKDRAVIMFMTNRTAQRFQAPDPVRPTSAVKFSSHAETIHHFEKSRARNLAYLETTEDDLRSHFSESGLGWIDGYQWLIVLSAHSERHTEQIREVKAHRNFPAK